MKNQELKRNIRRLNNISYNIKIAYDRIKEWNDKLVKLTKEQSKLKKEMEEKAKEYILNLYNRAKEFLNNIILEIYNKDVLDCFKELTDCLDIYLPSIEKEDYATMLQLKQYETFVPDSQAEGRLIIMLRNISINMLNGTKFNGAGIENRNLWIKTEDGYVLTFNLLFNIE